MNEYTKQWREANRERHLLHKKTYREKHREEIREKAKKYQQKKSSPKVVVTAPPSLIVSFC
eukprot:26280-Eustigmatos_ZCMA.PRE.1